MRIVEYKGENYLSIKTKGDSLVIKSLKDGTEKTVKKREIIKFYKKVKKIRPLHHNQKNERRYEKILSNKVAPIITRNIKELSQFSDRQKMKKRLLDMQKSMILPNIGQHILDQQRLVEKQHKAEFIRELNKRLGVDVSKIVNNNPSLKRASERFVRENTALVKDLLPSAYKRVEKAINNTKLDQEQLVKQLSKIPDITNNRAKLIARDQTQKYFSNLTEENHKNIGVTEYIWRTANDDRVRPTHEENEGKKFSYDDPPSATGNPGEDVNCRCVAEAVID